jgi:TolA-binding protein
MRQTHEVASGPQRKMSMAAENRTDVEKELSDLKKEIIESRNLVIKTDNLLKNLHAEVKTVGKWQADQQRKQWISSGVAYGLFAILAVGAASFVASARLSGVNDERDRLSKQVTEITSQIDKQKSELAANASAQRAAGEVYKMLTELPGDARLQGIDAFAKLDTSRLTTLEKAALHDRAEMLRKEVGDQTFERGKAAFRRNDMNAVVGELTRFQSMNPAQDDMLESSFFLGVAYNQLKKHELAVPQLARFVEGNKHAKTRDYAMLMLAQSYEATGQNDKAAQTARDAIGTYPNSQFMGQLRTRLGSANRAIKGEVAAAPSAVPGAPAPKPGPTPAH